MKILVLDGGGVFGDLQAKVLEKVDAFEKFDCFVGTSIGSAIAASIAMNQQDKATSEFFHKWMPIVFKKSLLRKMNPFSPKYNDTGLNMALKDMFGGTYFRDVKKPLFVTSANIGSETLKVFDWKGDNGWLLWDVIRCATAAETYFPSWKGYADGGVFANNPSMVAISAASRIMAEKLENMEVLSIGTGDRTGSGSGAPRAVWQWGMWLINSQLNGASDKMQDYFARSMPLKKYVRIQFSGRSSWEMDNPLHMIEAEKMLASQIEAAAEKVENF